MNIQSQRAGIITEMQRLVPPGSPEPTDPMTLRALVGLTSQLIDTFHAEGKLLEDPLATSRSRTIHLYEDRIRSIVAGKTVLVTGGAGCVGQHLISILRSFPLRRVISVDLEYSYSYMDRPLTDGQVVPVTQYVADVRDFGAMQAIFQAEKPEIVFHLAAQRLPGLAELLIRDTITTNVFGTQNLICLCEAYGVEHCVFSSTGKCFSYYTSNVYAATKKLAEWQFAMARENSTFTSYDMVRFTHIINNSAVCRDIDEGMERGIVKLHGPSRHINIQNTTQAAHLLLNALLFNKDERQLKFLTTRNLGWPVSSLEIALYKIDQGGRKVPVYFFGVPSGYDETFFKGQFDWSGDREIHALINALESPSTAVDEAGDMNITSVLPFPADLVTASIEKLKLLSGDLSIPQEKLKEELACISKEIAVQVFNQFNPATIARILKWGASPRVLKVENVDIKYHKIVVELLVRSLHNRLHEVAPEDAEPTFKAIQDVMESLSVLPSIQAEVEYFQQTIGQKVA
jgi:nucleoside-diphosphate-sugar epimerase